MQRKYTVHINGRLLTMISEADAHDAFPGCAVAVAGSRSAIMERVDAWQRDTNAPPLVLTGDHAEDVWDKFRSHYRFVQAAGGCVTDEHKRLLAIHRLGVWDLPKGKVDDSEAVDAAALREVREECGLVRVELIQRLCDTWHTYERNGEQHLKRTDWYWMLSNSAEKLIAQHEEDISEVRWMDTSGVEELKRGTYPSLLDVIAAWERAIHHRA